MKSFNKKGFSLLEVMLAVAIMAITSSMIMYGFLSSMNYANNTSIYARVAAVNTGRGYFYMSDHDNITDRHTRYESLKTNSNSEGGSLHTVTLAGPVALTGGSNTIQMRTFRLTGTDAGYTDLDDTFNVTSGAASLDAAYADINEGTGTTYDDATVADNRTSFFYTIPPDVNWPTGYYSPDATCPICGRSYELRMYRRGGEGYTGNYHWVCPNWNISDPGNDHTSYRQAVLAQW